MKYLKEKWGVESTWHFIIINVVFACTGFSVLYVKDYIYSLFGLSDAGFWIKALLFVLLVLPLYNLLLLVWGIVFGQFRFFWNYEKRFFSRIFKLFSSKSGSTEI
jgi:hypothetical protein